MTERLVVNEIYLSIQGESTFAGLPCVFVRLTGCDLRCSYCDTAYAFKQGTGRTIQSVQEEVRHLSKAFEKPNAGPRLPLVELTGGEPLLQRNALELMKALCDEGFTVLIETSGAHDISQIDARVRRIVDLKCPGSGEVSRNRWENIPHLRPTDEVKCVISSVQDYEWAKAQITTRALPLICPVLFSWAAPLTPEQQDRSLKPMPPGHTPITRQELVERILADALPIRFQMQLHKVIWAPDARSV